MEAEVIRGIPLKSGGPHVGEEFGGILALEDTSLQRQGRALTDWYPGDQGQQTHGAVDGNIARYLVALDRADREEGDIGEAKAHRRKEKSRVCEARCRSSALMHLASIEAEFVAISQLEAPSNAVRNASPRKRHELIALGSNHDWVRRPGFRRRRRADRARAVSLAAPRSQKVVPGGVAPSW